LMKYASQRPPQAAQLDQEAHQVTFYFYNLGTGLERSPEGLLRSLLHQLFGPFPDKLGHLPKAYLKRLRGSLESWNWNIDELLDLLDQALSALLEHMPVRVYVDALDECRNDANYDDDDTEEIRSLITEFGRLTQKLK